MGDERAERAKKATEKWLEAIRDMAGGPPRGSFLYALKHEVDHPGGAHTDLLRRVLQWCENLPDTTQAARALKMREALLAFDFIFAHPRSHQDGWSYLLRLLEGDTREEALLVVTQAKAVAIPNTSSVRRSVRRGLRAMGMAAHFKVPGS